MISASFAGIYIIPTLSGAFVPSYYLFTPILKTSPNAD